MFSLLSENCKLRILFTRFKNCGKNRVRAKQRYSTQLKLNEQFFVSVK